MRERLGMARDLGAQDRQIMIVAELFGELVATGRASSL